MYGTNYGGESGDVTGFEFSEKSIRHAFIRYLIFILNLKIVTPYKLLYYSCLFVLNTGKYIF